MTWLRAAPWLGLAAAGIAAYLLFGQLQAANVKIGQLETSNAQLQATINAKTNATRNRAQTDNSVRKLPPAELLERLR